LNILIQYNASGTPVYRGIYYNSTKNFIYVAPQVLSVIHVFNLKLSLNHSFSTSPFYPFSITEYSNQFYVGSTEGTILVIDNEAIKYTFMGCNGNSPLLTYILFDDCGLMATSCFYSTNQLYLYHPNGTYLNKNFATPFHPHYIGYDSKGNFIQLSYSQISIYN
jgi:hypothetical protein